DITAGTVTLTITTDDPTGPCEAANDEMIITINPLPNVNAGVGKTITCIDETVVLNGSASISDQSTLSYQWSTSNGIIESGATTLTPTVSAAGTYTLSVISNYGCSSRDEVVVNYNKVDPTISIIAENTELNCDTPSIKLNAVTESIQGTPSYLWLGTNETTSSIEVTKSGDYLVFVTDSENGCVSSSRITITEDFIKPIVEITGDSELTCTKTSTILDAGSSSVQGEAEYLWSTGATTSSIEIDTPGDYSVTVTDSDNGCSAQSEVFTVNQDITEVIAIITGASELTCSVTSVELDASGSTFQGTASYLWNTGATTATIDVDEPGVYSVTVTDSDNGCSATSTEFIVTQDIKEVTATITGESELTCAVTSIVLDASESKVQGTASYLWNTGATSSSIEIGEPGAYSVIVTDSDNGCSTQSDVFTVTKDVTEVVAMITGDAVINCDITSITLDASSSTIQGTASYLWSTGATTATIDVTEAGNYSVTVTDSDNGCSSVSSDFIVTNKSANIEAIITGGSELTCAITSVTLDASSSTVQGTASYLWNTGETTTTIIVDTPGNYSVKVTDSDNGCSTTSEVFVVSEDVTDVIAIITNESSVVTCNSPIITLDASSSTIQGTAIYKWS
ncbi:hypothetical protein, partial [uncultured Lutibacter sp.]|uniref:PKD domain-containing protein n=1 Tax=uncultured Lutibacter sp. TaxID=437739 RepID=UPI0026018AC6